MTNTLRLSFLFLTGLLTLSNAHADPLTLIAAGKGNYTIVVEDESPKSAQAAGILRDHLAQMTGVTLAVREERTLPTVRLATPHMIYVGHTRAAKELGLKIPAGYDTTVRPDYGNEEGYILKTADHNLFVAGNNDGPYRGTFFAVYALLEKLGCRFYLPGAWGTIVPQTQTVTLPELDITARPAFSVRTIVLSGWIPVSKDERAIFERWGDAHGMGGGDLYPVAGDGYLSMLLPPQEYGESHPEYYAMRLDGTRRLPVSRTGALAPRNTMLCLSNPDVLQQSIANIREALDGKRKMTNVTPLGVGISPPDGAPFCYCDKCKAANQGFAYPTYVQEKMTSEEYFGFCAELARAFPDKFVASMAYSNREVPPQGIQPFPQNISVKHATISCDVLHPTDAPLWRRREMLSMLKQWRVLTPHVIVRDYMPGMLIGLYIPERDVANMAINAPLYQTLGVKGMIREGRKVNMQTWISYYITAKLLWDPKADVAALKQEFYGTFFGAAAGPHVQAWWDEYETALGQTHVQVHEDWLLSHLLRTAFTDQLNVHVEAARAAPAEPVQHARVEAFALIAQHLREIVAMLEAERTLDYPAAAAAAGRAHALKLRLSEIDPFFYTANPRRDSHSEMTFGRQQKLQQLADLTTGKNGQLLAPLPLEMNVSRDVYNEGVPMQWYLPTYDASKWPRRNTYELLEQQEPGEDAAGHDYDGYLWYRADVSLPAGEGSVRFYSGGAINEAWVWINGQYVGHKAHRLWWGRNQDFDLDVSAFIKPGAPNTVAIRVLNDGDVGGLFRRGFFYRPTATTASSPAAETGDTAGDS